MSKKILWAMVAVLSLSLLATVLRTSNTHAAASTNSLEWTVVHNNESTAGAYATVSTSAVGDVVVAQLHLLPSSAEHFTGITDSNHRVSWQTSPSVQITGSGASGNTLAIYYGTVTSVGPTKITTTHSGSNNFDGFVIAQEWHSTAYGQSAAWSVVTAGSKEGYGTGKTVEFPSLKSGNGSDVYFGWSYPADTGVIPATKQGFTWKITNTGLPDATNILVYRDGLTTGTTYAPRGQQIASSWYVDDAAILQATGTATTPPPPVTPPKTTPPVTKCQ